MTPGGEVHVGISSIPTANPLILRALPYPEQSDLYASNITDQAEAPGLCGDLARAEISAVSATSLANDVAWEEVALLDIRKAFARQDYTVSLATAQRLEQSTHAYYRRWATRFVCHSLLSLGRAKDCADYLVAMYLDERGWHDVLPIADAAAAVKLAGHRSWGEGLSPSILFELHRKHIDASYESACTLSFVAFLDAHGMARPSSVGQLRDQLDHKMLVYFLRFVCVDTTMERSGLFPGSTALLEERMAVCRLLVELDPDGSPDYHAEVKELARRLMVKKRLAEVEHTRIFVDIDSIRRNVIDDLTESYNRYTALCRESAPPYLHGGIIACR